MLTATARFSSTMGDESTKGQRIVEMRDARPVGGLGRGCASVTRGNRGLQREWSASAAQLFGAAQSRQTAANQ